MIKNNYYIEGFCEVCTKYEQLNRRHICKKCNETKDDITNVLDDMHDMLVVLS